MWTRCFSNPISAPQLTEAQSRQRVAELRKQGFKVHKVKLADGTMVVLRSKKPLGSNPGEVRAGAKFAVGFIIVWVLIGIAARNL